jgi:methylated-DNA-[protein]-cysteine S-methyltransferase
MKYTIMPSPVGPLTIAGEEDCLHSIQFSPGKRTTKPDPDWQASNCELLRETVRQLRAYFAHKLTEFDLPLQLSGTLFQLDVWRELRGIPYGKTISYGELAQRIGKPLASRAVGAANRSNAIPIVIPCHRVIGSNGMLTGFGGGLPIKQALLEIEGAKILDMRKYSK